MLVREFLENNLCKHTISIGKSIAILFNGQLLAAMLTYSDTREDRLSFLIEIAQKIKPQLQDASIFEIRMSWKKNVQG